LLCHASTSFNYADDAIQLALFAANYCANLTKEGGQ